MSTKQVACKLCGATFVCNNGMWSTTCDCARRTMSDERVNDKGGSRYLGLEKSADGEAVLVLTDVEGNEVPLRDLQGRTFRVDMVSGEAMVLVTVPTWKPITTAPKDGTWVLIGWLGAPRMYVSRWLTNGEGWVHPPTSAPLKTPTHWMPLPANPTAEKDTDRQTKPTTPGFYWRRYSTGERWEVCEVMKDMHVFFAGSPRGYALSDIDGEWEGPLPEPPALTTRSNADE